MVKNRDLELLYELGAIRFIPRAWKQFFNADFENLAEHHFRVAWLGMILAKMENKGDTGKIVKMALVHDITESRTGDVHAIARQYTKRDEQLAMEDMLNNTSLKIEFEQLWHEYEDRKTMEAKIVKDADWLDIDLEIVEQLARGHSSLRVWLPQRKLVYKRFYTKAAKKLWTAIHNSDPFDWLLHARSRFNEGDMKPINPTKIPKKY